MPDEFQKFLQGRNDDTAKRFAIEKGAAELGINPVDYAAAISYESARSFDPWKKGTRTKWGIHRGTIQYGEPQQKKYGVYQGQPFDDQVTRSNVKYLRDAGIKPGMTFDEVYAAINAGNPRANRNTPDANTGRTLGDNIRIAKNVHRKEALNRFWGGQEPGDEFAAFTSQKSAEPDEFQKFLANRQPVPEPVKTIALQKDSAANPKVKSRTGVLLNKGDEPKPEEWEGFGQHQTPDGRTMMVHAESAAKNLKLKTPEDVQTFIDKNPKAIERMIGVVDPVENTGGGQPVVTAQVGGNEAASAVVTSPEKAAHQAEVYAEQFPQANIGLTNTDQIAQQRVQSRGQASVPRRNGTQVTAPALSQDKDFVTWARASKLPLNEESRRMYEGIGVSVNPADFKIDGEPVTSFSLGTTTKGGTLGDGQREYGKPIDDLNRVVNTFAPTSANDDRDAAIQALVEVGRNWNITEGEAAKYVDSLRSPLAMKGWTPGTEIQVTYKDIAKIRGEDVVKADLGIKQVQNRLNVPDLRVGRDWVQEDAKALAQAVGLPSGVIGEVLAAGGRSANTLAGLLKTIQTLNPAKLDSMAEAAGQKPYRAGQDVIDYLKNIGDVTGAFSQATGPKIETVAEEGDKGYLPGRPKTVDTWGGAIAKGLGATADVPRLILMPGNLVTGLAIDAALQAAAEGKDVDWNKVAKAGGAGAATGAALGGIGRFARFAGSKAVNRYLTPEVVAALNNPEAGKSFITATVQKARKIQNLAKEGVPGEKENAQRLLKTFLEKNGLTEADLIAKEVGITPQIQAAMRKAAIARTLVERGTSIGLIGTAGAATAFAEGKSPEEALKQGLQWIVMDAALGMLNKRPKEAWTAEDIAKADGSIIKVVDPQGKSRDVLLIADESGKNLKAVDVTKEKLPDDAIDIAAVPEKPKDWLTAIDEASAEVAKDYQIPSQKPAQEKGFEVVKEGEPKGVGVAQLKEQRDVALRKAETDTLTDMANPTALKKALPSAEADPQTAIIAFDANNLGKVNKVAGHEAGDKAIVELAGAIKQAASEFGNERVFRRGGDEFVVLADKDTADKIRQRAEEIYGSKKYGDVEVSLSGTVGNTFAEADSTLQAAKAERKSGIPSAAVLAVVPSADTKAERAVKRKGFAKAAEQAAPQEPQAKPKTSPLEMATAKRQTDTPEFKKWFGKSAVVDEKGKPLVVYHGTDAKSDFEVFRKAPYDVGFHFGSAEVANVRLDWKARPLRQGEPEQRINHRLLPAYIRLENPLRLDGDPTMWNPDNLPFYFREHTPGLFNEAELRDLERYEHLSFEAELQAAKDYGIDLDDIENKGNEDALAALESYRGEVENDFTERVVELLKNKGYDGIVYQNDNETTSKGIEPSYVVFEPTQIKSAIGNRGTFDPKDPNILHAKNEPTPEMRELKETLAAPNIEVARYTRTGSQIKFDNLNAWVMAMQAADEAFEGNHLSKGLTLYGNHLEAYQKALTDFHKEMAAKPDLYSQQAIDGLERFIKTVEDAAKTRRKGTVELILTADAIVEENVHATDVQRMATEDILDAISPEYFKRVQESALFKNAKDFLQTYGYNVRNEANAKMAVYEFATKLRAGNFEELGIDRIKDKEAIIDGVADWIKNFKEVNGDLTGAEYEEISKTTAFLYQAAKARLAEQSRQDSETGRKADEDRQISDDGKGQKGSDLARDQQGKDSGVSKIGKSIEAKAIEQGLTEGFPQTAGYDKKHVQDQIDRINKLIAEDVDAVREMALGLKPIPPAISPVMLLRGMEEVAKLTKDAQLQYELANSPLVSETSYHAQEMRMMQEREQDSATALIQSLRRERAAKMSKWLRGRTVEEAIKEEAEKMAATMKTHKRRAATRESWDTFIASIEC